MVEEREAIADNSLIVVESPSFKEISFAESDADNDQPKLTTILGESGNCLTVFSSCVKPIGDTALARQHIHVSSSSSLAQLSAQTPADDHLMSEE